MYGRGVGRRLWHGAPRFPELHGRGRVARGDGGPKLPRRHLPLFAFGEARALQGIGRAFVSFAVVETCGRLIPIGVCAVRLDNWLAARRRHLERHPAAASET